MNEATLTREHFAQHLANHIGSRPLPVANITPETLDQPLKQWGFDVHNQRDGHSLQQMLWPVGAFHQNQVIGLLQQPGAHPAAAHVVAAQRVQLAVANSAELQPQLIRVNGIHRVEAIARAGRPTTAVVVVAGDQQGMTPPGTQLLGQTGGQGGLAGRRRPADAHQRNCPRQALPSSRTMLTTPPKRSRKNSSR